MLRERRLWLLPRRGRRRLEERLDAVRGTCFSLLYDLNAWLAGSKGAVPLEVREYSLTAFRNLADPRERLGRYAASELLEAWERALGPFFAAGAALAPDLGETARLWVEGLEGEGEARAELRFTSRSSIQERGNGRQALAGQEWLLEVSLVADLDRVEDARLRRL